MKKRENQVQPLLVLFSHQLESQARLCLRKLNDLKAKRDEVMSIARGSAFIELRGSGAGGYQPRVFVLRLMPRNTAVRRNM